MVNSRQQARLATLLEPVHQKATRFCLRLCTTRQDAEDLYHDAVLAAWHGLRGLMDEAQFGPWFYRIIVNAFRNRERRRKWRRWVSLDSTDAANGAVKIRTVETGPGLQQINGKIALPQLDPNLSDAEKIAEVKRQLAANGITNADVMIENGHVKVEVKQEKTVH